MLILAVQICCLSMLPVSDDPGRDCRLNVNQAVHRTGLTLSNASIPFREVASCKIGSDTELLVKKQHDEDSIFVVETDASFLSVDRSKVCGPGYRLEVFGPEIMSLHSCNVRLQV